MIVVVGILYLLTTNWTAIEGGEVPDLERPQQTSAAPVNGPKQRNGKGLVCTDEIHASK